MSVMAILMSFLLIQSVAFTTSVVSSSGAGEGNTGVACVSNQFLRAEVEQSSGLFSFMTGSCANGFNPVQDILFGSGTLWTSFVTVADFSTGTFYTEGGSGGGASLGVPASVNVEGNSIVTVFPSNSAGLVVTQNITVVGNSSAASAILMDVAVSNQNSSPQNVGIRYLWDLQVAGYDGTWIREYDGGVAGAILGHEILFNPPPANFTSYAMAGCTPLNSSSMAFTCPLSNFGAGPNDFTVFGTVGSGPGASAPARFVYGSWGEMSHTTYGYAVNPANEVGSYEPNVGGSQDSAVLYYFSNQTVSGGGAISYQADVMGSPLGRSVASGSITLGPTGGPGGTLVALTGSGLAPSSEVALASFSGVGEVPLDGNCMTDSNGNLVPNDRCTFIVPASAAIGPHTLVFSDGFQTISAVFSVTNSGIVPIATVTSTTCSSTNTVVGTVVICRALVRGSVPPPAGSVAWSVSGLGKFSPSSCKLAGEGSFSICGVRFTPAQGSTALVVAATYGGDSRDLPSAGTFSMDVSTRASSTSVTCALTTVTSSSSAEITCTARVTGYLPTGVVAWTQSGAGSVQFVSASCSLSQSSGPPTSKASLLIYSLLHGAPVGICHVVIAGARPGKVTVQASYTGDAGNSPSSGSTVVTVGRASPKVTISCATTQPSVGTSVTCTATVLNGYQPNGTVTWTKVSGGGGVTIAPKSCTLFSGSCSVSVTAVTSGSVIVKAAYSGDPNNLPSAGTAGMSIS